MLVHSLAQPELRPGEEQVGLDPMPRIAEQVLRNLHQLSLTGVMNVLVHTPGRLIQLLNERTTNLSTLFLNPPLPLLHLYFLR